MDSLLVKYAKWKIALWFKMKQIEFSNIFLVKVSKQAIKTLSPASKSSFSFVSFLALMLKLTLSRVFHKALFLIDLVNLVDYPKHILLIYI